MEIPMGRPVDKTDNLASLIEWLAAFGATESEGVTRLLYSKPWVQAQHAMKERMERAGFDTYFDSVGNLFGRLQGTDVQSKAVLTGSHIDTVVDGGKYDGAYGVIASFLAVQRLYQKFGPPRKSIEVVSFCEEEGSRFPLTFWGSRNIRGIYNLEHVSGITDTNGIDFLSAMKEAGFDPDSYVTPVRNDIDRFVEIHIEQGMILEKNSKEIGVVSHIVGQRRYTVTVQGESNHAGTTPMYYRRDALHAASVFIAHLTKAAKESGPDLVSTVGKLEVKPNVPNVVAGEVVFSLDIRHYEAEVLDSYCQEVFSTIRKLAGELGVVVEISQWMDVFPVKMDEEMNQVVREVAWKKNIRFQEMISGAGHDAQVFGEMIPTCLIFVPSKDGISHSPKEFTNVSDLEKGIDVLTEVLYRLAY